jgi:hypothetical protein
VEGGELTDGVVGGGFLFWLELEPRHRRKEGSEEEGKKKGR